jgi:hypothetical protein
MNCNCVTSECTDCSGFDCNVCTYTECVCNCNNTECLCRENCVCGDCKETCNCL